MSVRIIELLNDIGADQKIRAVVLAAEGRCFCAGADVAEYAGHSYDQFVAYQRGGRELNDLIERLPRATTSERSTLATTSWPTVT